MLLGRIFSLGLLGFFFDIIFALMINCEGNIIIVLSSSRQLWSEFLKFPTLILFFHFAAEKKPQIGETSGTIFSEEKCGTNHANCSWEQGKGKKVTWQLEHIGNRKTISPTKLAFSLNNALTKLNKEEKMHNCRTGVKRTISPFLFPIFTYYLMKWDSLFDVPNIDHSFRFCGELLLKCSRQLDLGK